MEQMKAVDITDAARVFIDDAAIEDGREDEEDEEDEENDFVVSEDEQTTNASSFDLAQFLRDEAAELDKDDAEVIADRFRQRAQGDSLASIQARIRAERQAPGVQPVTGETAEVDERMHAEFDGLMPMWIIPTRYGLEMSYVPFVNQWLPSTAQAFAVPRLSGRIYAYAPFRTIVEEACARYTGIMTRKMKLVPEDDRRSVWNLFRHRTAIPVVKPDSFVRIRHGQYKGDVAYVPSTANSTLPPTTSENSQSVEGDDLLVLWVVPRLDLTFNTKPKPLDSDCSSRPSKRRRIEEKKKEEKVQRPNPTPFDPKNILDCLRRLQLFDDPKYALIEHCASKWTFMDRTFENGFERLHVYGMHAVKSIFRPIPEEVASFIGFSQTATRVTNAAYTRVGDRVRTITNGPGTILFSTNSTFTVRLDWDTDGNTAQEVEAGDFERLFELGEWVDVKLGSDAGRSGAVVAFDGPYLTLADRDAKTMRYNIHYELVQRSAAVIRYKTRRPLRSEVELKTYAQTSGLVDKNEMVASFVGKEVYVIRGSGKGRIGRAIGVGSNVATVVFDGSQDKHKVGLTDAVNEESMLYLDASEPCPITLTAVELAIVYIADCECETPATDTVAETDAVDESDTTISVAAPNLAAMRDSFSGYPSPDTTGAWLWSESLIPVLGQYRVYGVISFSGKQGSNSGQACWTVSSDHAPYMKLCEETEREWWASFVALLRFNNKNGTKGAEFMAGPLDFDVHRPSIGNMAYVVRGPHKKTIVKIADLVRDNKKNVIGFKAKLEPFVARCRSIIVKLGEVTKLELLPENERKELATCQVYGEVPAGSKTRRVPFNLMYPDY